jgi:hypothetical protein
VRFAQPAVDAAPRGFRDWNKEISAVPRNGVAAPIIDSSRAIPTGKASFKTAKRRLIILDRVHIREIKPNVSPSPAYTISVKVCSGELAQALVSALRRGHSDMTKLTPSMTVQQSH